MKLTEEQINYLINENSTFDKVFVNGEFDSYSWCGELDGFNYMYSSLSDNLPEGCGVDMLENSLRINLSYQDYVDFNQNNGYFNTKIKTNK